MLRFIQWLEYGYPYGQNAGMVDAASMNNVAADDPFKQLRSKYMAGNVPQRGKDFDPDKSFGKNRKSKIDNRKLKRR